MNLVKVTCCIEAIAYTQRICARTFFPKIISCTQKPEGPIIVPILLLIMLESDIL